MKISELAQMQADSMDAGALRIIARHCQLVATRYNDGMSEEEISKFANLEAAINDIMELQSEAIQKNSKRFAKEAQ